MGGKVDQARLALEALNARYPMLGTFSTLDQAIQDAKMGKAPGSQWSSYLKPGREVNRNGSKFGLKAEELDWTGPDFKALLQSGDSVSKDQLLSALRGGRDPFGLNYGSSRTADMAFTRENQRANILRQSGWGITPPTNASPAAQDMQRLAPTADIIPAQYTNRDWRSPGAKNYKELVTTYPNTDEHLSGHFSKGLSWSRFGDMGGTRKDPLTLLTDEVQSDVHQKANGDYAPLGTTAREEGNRRYAEATAKLQAAGLEVDGNMASWLSAGEFEKLPTDLQQLYSKTRRLGPQGYDRSYSPKSVYEYNPAPNAPFRHDAWVDHELKKGLLTAANLGYPRWGIVNPGIVGSRYSDNPGLRAFYEKSVIPRFQSLVGKYGGTPYEAQGLYKSPKPSADDRLRIADLRASAARVENAADDRLQISDLAGDLLHTDNPARLRAYIANQGADPDLFDAEIHQHFDTGPPSSDKRRYTSTAAILNKMANLKEQQFKAASNAVTQSPTIVTDIPDDLREHILNTGTPLFAEGGPVSIHDQLVDANKQALSYVPLVGPWLKDSDTANRLMQQAQQGAASQVMSTDAQGNASLGVPGLAYGALSLPVLGELLSGGHYHAPQWAHDASDRADQIAAATQKALGVDDPRGTAEHIANAAGIMITQVPTGATGLMKGAGKYLPKITKLLHKYMGALSDASPRPARAFSRAVGSTLGAGAEWFGPTIHPTPANYAVGTAFGAGIPIAMEHMQGGQEQPSQEPSASDPVSDAVSTLPFAEGGKVGRAKPLTDLIRKYLVEYRGLTGPSHQQYINQPYLLGDWGHNTPQYIDLLKKYNWNPKMSPGDFKTLERYSAGAPWLDTQHDSDHLDYLINKHGVVLPPDLDLYRGQQLDADSGKRMKESLFDVSDRARSTSLDPEQSETFSGHSYPGSPFRPAMFSLTPGTEKVLPLPNSGQSEFVIPRGRKGALYLSHLKEEYPYEQFPDAVEYRGAGQIGPGYHFHDEYSGGGKVKGAKDALATFNPVAHPISPRTCQSGE